MKKTLEEISLTKGEYGGGFSAVDYFDNAPRYIRITDITDEGQLNEEIKAPSGSLKEWEKYLLYEGDLLFARSGATVGKTFLYNEKYGKCIFAGYLIRFKLNTEIAFPKYIYYYTKTPEYYSWIEKKQNVVAQPNINAKQYGLELEIPLPPLETQQRIAAILDAADAYRQKTKTLIEKYDQLAQSLFLDMFGDPLRNEKGWETNFLEDICDVGSSRRVFVNELVDSGIPFYRGTEVGKLGNDEIINPSLFITKEHFENLKTQTGVPKVGDLLMPSICPDGRIFRVVNEEPFYFKDGRVLWIKVNESNINSIYLKAILKVSFQSNYASIASGTTFAELKIIALKKIEILYPPITLQTQFAERIQLIEAQKQQAQASLQKAEDLFNSLLQRAFKGELVS